MSAAIKQIDRRNANIALRLNGADIEVSFARYKTLLEVPAI